MRASPGTSAPTAWAAAIVLAAAAAIGVAARQPSAASVELNAVIDAGLVRPARGIGAGGQRARDGRSAADASSAHRPGRAVVRRADRPPLRRDDSDRTAGRRAPGRGATPMGEAAYTRMLREQHLLSVRRRRPLDVHAWQEFDAHRSRARRARARDRSEEDLAADRQRRQDAPSRRREDDRGAPGDRRQGARAHRREGSDDDCRGRRRVTVVRRVPTAGNNPYYGSFSGATVAAAGGRRHAARRVADQPVRSGLGRRRSSATTCVEHDWGVILVTAPHETYGGHHVQMLYQMHNPRQLRRLMSTLDVHRRLGPLQRAAVPGDRLLPRRDDPPPAAAAAPVAQRARRSTTAACRPAA